MTLYDLQMSLFLVVFLLALTGIYFAPTIIAVARNHKSTAAIVFLNICFAWLVFPWVLAILWALSNPTKATTAVTIIQAPLPPTYCDPQQLRLDAIDRERGRLFDGR